MSEPTTILWLPLRTPSLNTWQRMHWRTRKRAQDQIRLALLAELSALKRLRTRAPDYAVAVTVRRSYRSRPMDMDNLYASCKPLLDALKGLAQIADDSPEWCELRCEQEQDARPWTRVRVEPRPARARRDP